MKQLDYESSNYKHKEDIKIFVNTFNELADKYVKNFENSDSDLKKISASIAKKNNSIEKLEASLLDLGNKTTELGALKDLSNEEIKELNAKKSSISYTDSEVQKMELDDINSQITAKKSKITKIDAKIDATKTKIKAGNEEKKVSQKELQELEKTKLTEEEALFKTQSLVSLVKELKEEMNNRALDIVNAPYKPQKVEEPTISTEKPIVEPLDIIDADDLNSKLPEVEEIIIDTALADTEVVPSVVDFQESLSEEDLASKAIEIPSDEEDEEDEGGLVLGTSEIPLDPIVSETKEDEQTLQGEVDSLLKDKFATEGVDITKFSAFALDKMSSNREAVLKNVDILKKHAVPLEYTVDQPEIFYDINSQDLDDLLSIITTDDEGNGMGFTIDFTFNILTELSKINVDKLIDVYNEEFMNVNAKSGIIYLLKLTNPSLTEFEKNRRTNIEILRGLGANTVDDIVAKHPEFVNMDNPLFINVLNVFDKSDLVEKLNTDVDVVTKIIDYWKNN